MANFNRAETHEAGDGTLFESMSCGCPSRSPINVPHWLIVEAVEQNLGVIDTAARLANRPAGRESAVRGAARAMMEAGVIPGLPEGWT